MDKKEKKFYIPPTLEITRVVLEGNIAVQSPVQKVNLQNWVDEGPAIDENNADVWLNI